MKCDFKAKRITSMVYIGPVNANVVMYALSFLELHIVFYYFPYYPLLIFELFSLGNLLFIKFNLSFFAVSNGHFFIPPTN